MAKKPTAEDAQVILKLYELRSEPVMRAARKFMVSEFWPQNYEEFKAVLTGYGTDKNAYLRQVITYWDMAAAMVLSGALNEDLFFETNSEPYFLWAKFAEFMPQARKDFANSWIGLHLDKLAARPNGQKRIKELRARNAARHPRVVVKEEKKEQ